MFLTDGAICVTQNSLRGGRVRDPLKINHTTFLFWRMSIGYLEPLVGVFINSSCHVTRKRLCPLETCTSRADHFTSEGGGGGVDKKKSLLFFPRISKLCLLNTSQAKF